MKSETSHLKLVVNGDTAPEAALPEVAASSWPLTGSEAELFETIMDHLIVKMKGKNLSTKTTTAIEQVNRTAVQEIGKAPWRWSEDDFNRWSVQHRERGNSSNTLRTYQGLIRRFMEYIEKNAAFTSEIREKYGIVFENVATEENCVVHSTDDNTERRMLEDRHFDAMMEGIDKAISEAEITGSKNYWPLLRDKVMFALWHDSGCRDGEVLGMDIHSFFANALCPQMGYFGFVKVFGKGSKGSGLRMRDVALTRLELPLMLDIYIKEVRPKFLKLNNPDETALFLSQRGTRLKIGTLNKRFHEHLGRVGIDDIGYVPYSFRHSSVTNTRRTLSLEATMKKHGHKFASTTEGYCHFGDREIYQEISDFANRRLDFLMEDDF